MLEGKKTESIQSTVTIPQRYMNICKYKKDCRWRVTRYRSADARDMDGEVE